MCISTVHYCCHRNVMHSVSYKLSQLNGKPCLICSGSFIFILYWKGVCKYSGEGRWKERRQERMKDNERQKEAGSSPLLFTSPRVPPLRLPLFSIMSVLSVGSQCESVAIIYTHTVTLYCTHVAISSLILCAVFVSQVVSGEGRRCFGRHRNCWYSLCGDREKFYLRWYRHWKISGESGVFPEAQNELYSVSPYRSYLLLHWFSSFIT